MNQLLKQSVADEFAAVDLGDARREGRLRFIVGKMSEEPVVSFPYMTQDRSELESFYRFFGNEDVSYQEIVAGHVAATVARCQEHRVVLCLHDTTEFKFAGKRAGLMEAADGSTFSSHLSIAVLPGEQRIPLGLLAMQPFVSEQGAKAVTYRGKPKPKQKRSARYNTPREEKSSFRWDLGIDAATEALGDKVLALHICDREADDFALLAKLCTQKKHFVIRGSASRPVATGEGSRGRISSVLSSAEYELRREVEIATRLKSSAVYPRREARSCRLGIRASTVEVIAPQQAQTDIGSIHLNVVQVIELEPPAGAAPVEWTLYTTESIQTPEEVAFVVDAYRSRWVIEEYFKAIKTGCSYELRQLEHSHGLLNALATTLPIAWRLLLVRSLARSSMGTLPATKLWNSQEIKILGALVKRRRPLPSKPSIRDAMSSIAALGGHLKNNGDPGWLTLAKGYFKFVQALESSHLLLEAGLFREGSVEP